MIDRERADGIRRYEALERAAAASEVARQSLLFPDRVQLAPAQEEALERGRALLERLGFEWSQLGEGTYVVRAVPALVADTRAVHVFVAAVEAIEKGSGVTLEEVLTALATASASPNGAPLGDEDARRIAAAIWPSREGHSSCIAARIALPALDTNGTDG